MNTTVNFELAKLLKEKGFDEKCNQIYYNGTNEVRGYSHFLYSRDLKAPTITEVVMWLYEKHGIWISTDLINYTFKYKILIAEGIISSTVGNEIKCSSFDYKSPTEAYEAAIKYCLTELI